MRFLDIRMMRRPISNSNDFHVGTIGMLPRSYPLYVLGRPRPTGFLIHEKIQQLAGRPVWLWEQESITVWHRTCVTTNQSTKTCFQEHLRRRIMESNSHPSRRVLSHRDGLVY